MESKVGLSRRVGKKFTAYEKTLFMVTHELCKHCNILHFGSSTCDIKQKKTNSKQTVNNIIISTININPVLYRSMTLI